jgi:hypothetical protein
MHLKLLGSSDHRECPLYLRARKDSQFSLVSGWHGLSDNMIIMMSKASHPEPHGDHFTAFLAYTKGMLGIYPVVL